MNFLPIFPICLISVISGDIFSSSNINHSLQLIKRTAESIIDKSGVNSKCTTDLKALITDLFYRKLWALEMLDANGKLQPGLLYGNVYQIGNYDQCLNIKEDRNGNVIKGQYCSVLLLPSTNFSSKFSYYLDLAMNDLIRVKQTYHLTDILRSIKFIIGTCIPQSCSIENLQTIWNYVENTFKLPVHALFVDLFCNYKDKPLKPYPIDIYVYYFFGGIAALVFLATFCDILATKKQNQSILTAFSLYSNAKKLFSTKIDDNNLSCISGIKVISIFWIIQGHRLVINTFSANMNGFYIFEWMKHIENTIMNASSVSVDTFFALSGLLLMYGFLKYTEKGVKLKLSSFYAYRFFRLNIPLGATILVYISILKHLGDGPAWPLLVWKISGACYHTWYATFFHFSNLLRIDYQCMEQSWYLGVDTQLYILSPLILFNIRKHPKRTILATLSVCALSMTYAFYITLKNNHGAIYFEGNKDFYEKIYSPTYMRMPAWIIGIIFGHFIYQTKRRKFSMSNATNLFLWFAALTALICVILCHFLFTTQNYDVWRSANYNAFARPVWALGVCWVVFACANGYGGFINKFLSLPIFRILVRLTFSMYLMHLAVIVVLSGGQKYIGSFSNMRSFHDFWGDLVITLVVSIIFSLIFESPVLALGKIYIKKQTFKKVKKEKDVNSEVPRLVFWGFSIIGKKKKTEKLG